MNQTKRNETKTIGKRFTSTELETEQAEMLIEDLYAKIKACSRRQQVSTLLLQQVEDATSTLYLQLKRI